MPEPDRIVIPKSWVEFRHRFTDWYLGHNALEINCSFFLLALGPFLVFLVCTSFPESRICTVISLLLFSLGFLGFGALNVANSLIKKQTSLGHPYGGFRIYVDAVIYGLFGMIGFIIPFGFLVRQLILWYG